MEVLSYLRETCSEGQVGLLLPIISIVLITIIVVWRFILGLFLLQLEILFMPDLPCSCCGACCYCSSYSLSSYIVTCLLSLPLADHVTHSSPVAKA